MQVLQQGLSLITSEPTYDVEYLVEESSRKGEQNMYIVGPYLLAEVKNKNARVYTLDEMIPEIDRYNREMIQTNRSLGELNHPASAEINPERSCHIITELRQVGNTFNGKSKILNTPMGKIVRSLINDGVKLGVSSRALGKLVKENRGDVVKNFRFIAEDVVHDPSVDKAFVNGILESRQYVLKSDGSLEEYYEDLERDLEVLPKHDVNEYIKNKVLGFLSALKNR